MRVDAIALLVLCGSLGLNVYLGIDRARAPLVARAAEGPQLIKPGTPAPGFEFFGAGSKPVSLTFGGTRDTLLYVYSPTCHWCERNLANIRAIVKSRPDLRIVGVSLGKAGADPVADQIGFDTIVHPTAQTLSAYGLGATPSTVLVSRDGKVLQAWSGAYSGALGSEVSKVLAVNLPGLAE
jgi:peroxiredoxin